MDDRRGVFVGTGQRIRSWAHALCCELGCGREDFHEEQGDLLIALGAVEEEIQVYVRLG